MSRRSQLINAVRRNTTKQTAPKIIVIDPHDGGEPIATYALNHRKPTPAEIAAAIAEYTRDLATYVEPPTLKPAHGSGEEETEA